MARDPLAILQRLRDLEVTEAQRRLAERRAQEDLAQRQAEATAAALLSEAAQRDPHGFAAWMPRGRAEQERAARLAHIAGNQRAEAERGLAEARAALKGVERLAEMREEEAKKAREKKVQGLLDEVGARRGAAPHPAGVV
ncbi:hypothetical protein IAI18_21015 [Acetobacteraceae bacterium H6797]|nr:hypothetical protein [Acetobacteraceae bacterium H6797]